MAEHLPGDGDDGGLSELLTLVEKNFDNAIAAFQQMTERVRDDGDIAPAEAEKTARMLHSATQTLITLRLKITDERKRQTGAVNAYALDLDEAKQNVGRLLDRLRTNGGSDQVS